MKRLFDRLQLDWYKLPKITRFSQILIAFSVVVYVLLLLADGTAGAVYSLYGILLVGALGAVMCITDRHWTYAALDIGAAALLFLLTSLMNPQ